MSNFIEDAKHLQIPLKEILLATNQFAKDKFIGEGGFGPVYKGESEKHGCIAVKRLVNNQRKGQMQGNPEFTTEIALLLKYKHENIVSLLGFCAEHGEKILVYKYESNGSLDKHLKSENLSWVQRLWICLGSARGLKYLHEDVGTPGRILHRDVKSPNILLDENWNPKISDFGLSREGPELYSYVISHACGTPGYIDPYYEKNYLTPKADVYSFGVVMWEVLCGRPAVVSSYHDDRHYLTVLVEKVYNRGTLDQIIPSYLQKQISSDSLDKFSKIANQCLKNVEERPTMKQVVEQLQEVLQNQPEVKKTEKGKKPPKAEKPADGDEKREEYLSPPPLPQEIAFRVSMNCEGCATKIQKCLRGFEGVERVATDCINSKVIVKGEKADPLKVLERIKKESRQEVELLSPIPKVSADELKKPNTKVQQDRTANNGTEDVLMDCETCKFVEADSLKVQKSVQEKSHKKVELQSPVSEHSAQMPNKRKQENPHEMEENPLEMEDNRDDITHRNIYFLIFVIIVCFFIIFLYISKLVKLFKFKH